MMPIVVKMTIIDSKPIGLPNIKSNQKAMSEILFHNTSIHYSP